MDDDELDESEIPLEEIDDIATGPGDAADPVASVQRALPAGILKRYEVHSYRNAALILSETRQKEFAEIVSALEAFRITTTQIKTPGGNESEIPKAFNALLRPEGWFETTIRGDLRVQLTWKDNSRKVGSSETIRERFLDGHKIDFVKGRVACDMEWNSKDQTFDRDLYAFSAFWQCGVIDAAVLVTRSAQLNEVFRDLGPALDKSGNVVINKKTGKPSTILSKYGASTTWMGKLLYRLNAGRNGGCPVLVVGIGPKCKSDWRSE